MAIDWSLLKFGKGVSRKAAKKARHQVKVDDEAQVRRQVVARERGLCRAWVDGHRFPWCSRIGTERHEGKTRGAGGQVTTANAILLCQGCHNKRHGVGAWLRIIVRNADDPKGVSFVVREKRAEAVA